VDAEWAPMRDASLALSRIDLALSARDTCFTVSKYAILTYSQQGGRTPDGRGDAASSGPNALAPNIAGSILHRPAPRRGTGRDGREAQA